MSFAIKAAITLRRGLPLRVCPFGVSLSFFFAVDRIQDVYSAGSGPGHRFKA